MWKLCLCILALGTSMMGQDPFVAPVPALKSPAYDVGLGYDYLVLQDPSAPGVALNGLDANGVMKFNPKWAANIDVSYVRKGNVLGSGRVGYVLNFLAGPEFYLRRYRSVCTFTHVLVGNGLVDSAVPMNEGFLHGWVSRPSFGIGTGIEESFRGPFGVRVYGDYVRTAFANSFAAVEPQNNFRSVVSFVFRLPFKGKD
jgi:hypothetical protein